MYEVYSYFSSKLGVHYKIGISNICSIFNGKSLKKLNTWNSLKNQQNHHENANATGGTQSIFLSLWNWIQYVPHQIAFATNIFDNATIWNDAITCNNGCGIG